MYIHLLLFSVIKINTKKYRHRGPPWDPHQLLGRLQYIQFLCVMLGQCWTKAGEDNLVYFEFGKIRLCLRNVYTLIVSST